MTKLNKIDIPKMSEVYAGYSVAAWLVQKGIQNAIKANSSYRPLHQLYRLSLSSVRMLE